MKIEAVDFFYLSMPEVTTEGDGSQDALLVRVAAGGHIGWGECEASPLVSIAAFVCPMSHGACRPVALPCSGKRIDAPRTSNASPRKSTRQHGPAAGAAHLVRQSRSHSGICWAKHAASRSGRLLGYRQSIRKLPYASQLFGDTPQRRTRLAAAARAAELPRRQVRLGPDRPRRPADRHRHFQRGARRPGQRCAAAGRCRTDLWR